MMKQISLLVSGSCDGVITFWDLGDMTALKTVEGHTKKVYKFQTLDKISLFQKRRRVKNRQTQLNIQQK